MKFNDSEQMALLKVIDEVIMEDDNIYQGEAFFLSQLTRVFPFDMDRIREARKGDRQGALATLRAMPENKKQALAVMLNEAANADGKVHDGELRLICEIFEQVGIPCDEL